MPVGTFTSRVEYTAASWEDVLPAFKNFLESDPTLANAGETWTVEYFHDDRQDAFDNYQQLVVKMPGYGSPFQDGSFVFVSMANLASDLQVILGAPLKYGFYAPRDSISAYDTAFSRSEYKYVQIPMAKNNLMCHFYANAVSAALIVQSSGNTHGTIFGWAETYSPVSDWPRPFIMIGNAISSSNANGSYIEDWTSSSSYIRRAVISCPSRDLYLSEYSIYYARESERAAFWTVQNQDTGQEVLTANPMQLIFNAYLPVGQAPCVYVTSTQGVGQGDTFTAGGDSFFVYDGNGNGIYGMHALRYASGA